MYRYLLSCLLFISTLTIAQTDAPADQVVTVAGKSFLKSNFEQPAKKDKPDEENNQLRQDIFYFSQVNAFVLRTLVEDYAEHNQITPKPEHVEGFKQAYASAGVSEEKLASLANFNALRFATDKHMYEQLGGRVVFDQGHPKMPIEAYSKLLMAYKQSGRLVFHEQKYESLFWKSLERPDALEIPPQDVKYDSPWWMSVAR